MSATLTLPASKKVRELLGEYETEQTWVLWLEFHDTPSKFYPSGPVLVRKGQPLLQNIKNGEFYPAPDFGETVRLIMKMPFKDDNVVRYDILQGFACIYAVAPSPEEGMRLISEEILKLV